MRLNKKGFTLVELLAVIVILAVVMLIGGTTVLPMMQKAQKSSLGTEGASMKKAAETAFQAELIKGSQAAFKSTETVCFSLKVLCDSGNYDKGCTPAAGETGDGYTGSVLVTPGNPTTTYKMWISNGTYSYSGLDEQNITNPDKVDAETASVENCGGAGTPILWDSTNSKLKK